MRLSMPSESVESSGDGRGHERKRIDLSVWVVERGSYLGDVVLEGHHELVSRVVPELTRSIGENCDQLGDLESGKRHERRVVRRGVAHHLAMTEGRSVERLGARKRAR